MEVVGIVLVRGSSVIPNSLRV